MRSRRANGSRLVRLLSELTDAECVQFWTNSGLRETMGDVRWRHSRAPLTMESASANVTFALRQCEWRHGSQLILPRPDLCLPMPMPSHHTVARELHIAIWLLLYLSSETVLSTGNWTVGLFTGSPPQRIEAQRALSE